MLSTVQETSPIIATVGRCAVLDLNEYASVRPTEIAESDVYVCESMYDEFKKQITRVPNSGLRKFTHSQMVTPDEVFHFQRQINPVRVTVSEIAALQESNKQTPSSNLLDLGDLKMETSVVAGNTDLLGIMEDSLDDGPPSVGSDLVINQPSTSNLTPMTNKKGKLSKKLVTGYIVYSSEVRKSIVENNPNSTFGDISRIVGNEWRSMQASEKQPYEEKAAKCNEENAAKLQLFLDENGGACPSPGPPINLPDMTNQIFECCWDKCDWQFEDSSDCLEHCIGENTGHVQTHFASLPSNEIEYLCQWRGCIRVKKQAPAFPHLIRLIKHVREVHINKSSGRIVQPHDRSKNFMASKKQIIQNVQHVPMQNIQSPTQQHTNHQMHCKFIFYFF